MSKPLDTASKKAAGPSKLSAISKQVLKTNPIPQLVKPTASTSSPVTSPSTLEALRGKPTQPLRSTKVSQKLVMFPPSDEAEAMKSTLPVDSQDTTSNRRTSTSSYEWQVHSAPPTAGLALPIEWTFDSRTIAERMNKDERDIAGLPRAAAYCTGEGYDLTRLRPFLKEHHNAAPRLYDECLYAAYHFPLRTLRPDKDNLYNIRVRGSRHRTLEEDDLDYEEDHFQSTKQQSSQRYNDSETPNHFEDHTEKEEEEKEKLREPFKGGEVFIFDYGVVVFWNFRRAEELLMLEDFMQFSIEPFRDNPDEDMQIEEIHFQYDTSQMKPRIFNDMITLKSSNHMVKLTLSHGLSQSAVVARYEDIMDKTIEETKHFPKEMAETGRLGKTRAEITKINGQLFTLRMNVNLVSNVLDTPEIFWSEPALQPMYTAIREYLEIPQRAQILNDRLRVISDLLSMLRDHLTNFGVEYQTLIIIYLIIIAVCVACLEIAVKIMQSIEVV
ncbi:hypothetical protein BY458DRAFT_521215 [Sporodiniella umbellata]|nr:hypothetical protein BY458DRAFT_521215 [Sporodiniella umbellata]